MNIKDLKKELNINNQDIADMFNMTYGAYANSTAKERYENALYRFYSLIKKRGEKIKEKNQINKDQTNEPETKPLIIHGVVFSEAELCDTKFVCAKAESGLGRCKEKCSMCEV